MSEKLKSFTKRVNRDKDFIMSPKNDFAFKLLFGDEKNKDLLIAFLSAVVKVPKENFDGIRIMNSELLREFQEDRKGVLDVRAKTKDGKQINIEIQIMPTIHMPERTLYYWAKMYTSQIKSGDTYDKMKKCITINIMNEKCIPLNQLYTKYHIIEDEAQYQLTDVLEIYFLELEKLYDQYIPKEEDDLVVQWMRFISARTKGEMEMLGEQNQDIKKAVDVLEVISQDEKARMAYEAREAWLMDERSRRKEAMEAIEKGREKGREEGREEELMETIKILLRQKLGVIPADVQKLLDLSKRHQLEQLRNDIFQVEDMDQVRKYLN